MENVRCSNPAGIATYPPTSLNSVPIQEIQDEITYITPTHKSSSRRIKAIDDNEPLVDKTAALKLHSKKTERAQKRLEKKQAKAARRRPQANLFDLPSELLYIILNHLTPKDLFKLLRVSKTIRNFVLANKVSLARDIIKRRYRVLSQCFILPVPLHEVESSARSALLGEGRRELLNRQVKPYEHIKGIDPHKICSCMNCVWAWNYLCLILDLSHWQRNLSNREPLPIIKRGTTPEWNVALLDAHARIVDQAMICPLTYARILEKHLATTVQTLMRSVRRKNAVSKHRLYDITVEDAAAETDAFLERSGPANYEPPWRRDSYHYLEAFVPNRIWSRTKQEWVYYARSLHERDLQWVVDRFTPSKDLQQQTIEAAKMVTNSEQPLTLWSILENRPED